MTSSVWLIPQLARPRRRRKGIIMCPACERFVGDQPPNQPDLYLTNGILSRWQVETGSIRGACGCGEAFVIQTTREEEAS